MVSVHRIRWRAYWTTLALVVRVQLLLLLLVVVKKTRTTQHKLCKQTGAARDTRCGTVEALRKQNHQSFAFDKNCGLLWMLM